MIPLQGCLNGPAGQLATHAEVGCVAHLSLHPQAVASAHGGVVFVIAGSRLVLHFAVNALPVLQVLHTYVCRERVARAAEPQHQLRLEGVTARGVSAIGDGVGRFAAIVAVAVGV